MCCHLSHDGFAELSFLGGVGLEGRRVAGDAAGLAVLVASAVVYHDCVVSSVVGEGASRPIGVGQVHTFLAASKLVLLGLFPLCCRINFLLMDRWVNRRVRTSVELSCRLLFLPPSPAGRGGCFELDLRQRVAVGSGGLTVHLEFSSTVAPCPLVVGHCELYYPRP